MDIRVEKILNIWHKHFEDEDNKYTEYEASDIEYFVGCMIYNHFNFEYALDTMKTIDLSYDFLENCGADEYSKVQSLIKTIELNDEKEKIEFLQKFIDSSRKKYTSNELYLLDRLKYHLDALKDRFEKDLKAKQVVFNKPASKSRNPLL